MRSVESGLIVAVMVAVFGQVLYHVTAKNVSLDKQPWEIISGAYLFGFLLVSTVGYFFGNITISRVFSMSNLLPAATIGVAVACVELGYLYAYRHGLPVSVGALSVLALTTIALLPIALLVFHESFTISRALGIVLTIAGVWLIQANIKI